MGAAPTNQTQPTTTQAMTAFLQHLVTKWVEDGKTQKELAKAADVSESSITELKGGKVGTQTAEKIAGAFDMTLRELMERAEAWARANNVQAPAKRIEIKLPTDPEGRRALAAAILREDKTTDDAAILAVLDEPISHDTADLSVYRWALLMRRYQHEMEEGTRPPRR